MSRTKMTTAEARAVLDNTPREDLLALFDDARKRAKRNRNWAWWFGGLWAVSLAIDIATRAIVFAVVPL